jgi:uncharacterized protein YbjT (DUF2867 family)
VMIRPDSAVSRRDDPGSGVGQLLDWKRRSVRLVRASGAPYTIVRPGWFDHVAPGDGRLVFEQGDTGNGGISAGTRPRRSSSRAS